MAGVTTAVVSAATGVAGAVGAVKSGRRADNAAERQRELDREAIELAREQFEFSRGIYNRRSEQFDPVFDSLIAEAQRERTPDYGAIASDNAATFNAAEASRRIGLERRGIKPGDGQFDANARRSSLAEAASHVSARQNARRQYENDRFSRLGAVSGLGASLQGNALGNNFSSASLLNSSIGRSSINRANERDVYSRSASAGARAAIGQDWGSIIDAAFGNESEGG